MLLILRSLWEAPIVWVPIDEAQVPGWQGIANAQTPTWQTLPTTQAPVWAPVTT